MVGKLPAVSLGLLFCLSLAGTACGGSAATQQPSASPTPVKNARPFTPTELVFDSTGGLLASDCLQGYVYKISRSGGITVVAGTGLTTTSGLSGEGGPASHADLACPYGLAVDRSGGLLIADLANNRVRQISSSGLITTIAGSGPTGAGNGSFGGDGGASTQARLYRPISVLLGKDGNLYIGDMWNGAIRRVDSRGIMTTFAGTGTPGSNGGDGGPATKAQLNQPEGMSFDAAGNLYFAEFGSNRIRKIDTHGLITTIAGTGVAGYSGNGALATAATMRPDDLVFDSAGNLFVAEGGDHVVRVIDTNGIIRTVAGTGKAGCSGYGGPAARAQLTTPLSPVFDSTGDLYLTDGDCHAVLRIDHSGVIRVVAGSPR